jgi:hypothetical protein
VCEEQYNATSKRENSHIDLAKKPKGDGENAKPIPDINPNINTDTNQVSDPYKDSDKYTPNDKVSITGTHEEYLSKIDRWLTDCSDYIDSLQERYDSIDVKEEIGNLRHWLDYNPDRRRTKLKQWINNCLRKKSRQATYWNKRNWGGGGRPELRGMKEFKKKY